MNKWLWLPAFIVLYGIGVSAVWGVFSSISWLVSWDLLNPINLMMIVRGCLVFVMLSYGADKIARMLIEDT